MRTQLVLPTTLLATLAACGGSSSAPGDPGPATAIAAPSSLSVVTTESATAPGFVAPGATFDPGSDYEQDEASFHVYDPSMEALEQINNILCYIDMTAYDEMLNAGTYLALIDESKCEEGNDDGPAGSDTGQSSGAAAIEPSLWTIRSSREDGASPHIVKVWVQQQEDEGPTEIHCKTQLLRNATATNPFGEFELDFVVMEAGETEENAFIHGALETQPASSGQVGFRFFESFGDVTAVPSVGDFSRETKVAVSMSPDQTTGEARVRVRERYDFGGGDSGILTEEYVLAFDEDNVLRKREGDPATCLSRTDFTGNVWRYNLYDATTGQRIERESGFSFQTPGGDWGWIGYFGVWVPDHVTLTDGMTITRQDGSASVDYTLKLAPGKLIERTQGSLNLTEIEGDLFQWFEYDTVEFDYDLFLVEYTSGNFQRIAEFDDMSGVFVDLLTPTLIDTSVLGSVYLFSESLGGDVLYIHGDTTVSYWTEQFVNGSHALFGSGDTVDLYCYYDGLKSALTQADVEGGDIYLAVPGGGVGSPHHYVFDRTDMTLYHDTDGVGTLVAAGMAPGEDPPAFGPNTWGMRSGSMVLDTSGYAGMDEVWDEPTVYVYETGPHPWNQYAVVLDSMGDAVVFDPPLQFLYTHAQANDYNDDAAYDGSKNQLDYNGPGDLYGIPHQGVDLDGDSQPDRWYPVFNLLDGTLMGPTGTEYVSKAMEVEQQLAPDPLQCGALTLAGASALDLPGEDIFDMPNLGPVPEVGDEVSVIDGVVVAE